MLVEHQDDLNNQLHNHLYMVNIHHQHYRHLMIFQSQQEVLVHQHKYDEERQDVELHQNDHPSAQNGNHPIRHTINK